MSDVVQQLPALIGVAVGLIGSYLVTTMTERARWRRDYLARWEERRIVAYASYATTVKALFQLTLRIAAHQGLHSLGPALDPDEGLQRLFVAGNERAEKWETVLLVGSPDAVAAAREWHRTIWRLEELVRQGTCGKGEWAEAVERSGHARSRFYEVARRELGLVDPRAAEAATGLASRLADRMRNTGPSTAPQRTG